MSAPPTAQSNGHDRSSAPLPAWRIPALVIIAWLVLGFAIVWLGIDFRSPKTAFVAFAVVSAPVIYWLMWREDFEGIASTQRYRQALKSRKPLSAQEFYEEFYSPAGIDRGLVERFLKLTAEFWSVDCSMIRPEDNSCAMDGHDLDEEFIQRVQTEFAFELTDEDRAGIDGSFDSVIGWLAGTANPEKTH